MMISRKRRLVKKISGDKSISGNEVWLFESGFRTSLNLWVVHRAKISWLDKDEEMAKQSVDYCGEVAVPGAWIYEQQLLGFPSPQHKSAAGLDCPAV